MALKKQIGPDSELYIKIKHCQPDQMNPETFALLLFCERKISTGEITIVSMATEVLQGLQMTALSLDAGGNNPWKMAYDWMKQNHLIFKHFEDC